LGERLLCKQEVIGSIPFTSTKIRFEKEMRELSPFSYSYQIKIFDNRREKIRVK
jgi:hypothetical protein